MIDTRTSRKSIWLAALLALSATRIAVAATAEDPAASRTLLEMSNTARTQQGLTPLQWDDSLAHAARAHAELAAQNGQLSHQYPGEAALSPRVAEAGAHFQTVAENIAEGRSIEAIQDQWMNSPPHRANILDPELNAAGFAVVQKDNVYYGVAVFAHTLPNLSVDQIEAGVSKLLASEGLQIRPSHQDARQTCEMEDGVAGSSAPRFIQRWQCADASRLPAEFEQKLQSKQYKSAAVGACGSPNAGNGPTSYRVAVLLY